MNKFVLIIDLKDVFTKEQVIKCFSVSLGFPDYLKDNWDTFDDMINSLHTESSVVSSKKTKSVHLILKNIDIFKQRAYEEYRTLLEVLSEATNKKQRQDGIDFSFELDGQIKTN